MTAMIVYVTASNHNEAERIASDLVEKRLVACANILGPMTSIYRWEGEIAKEEEVPLILKTTADKIDQVIAEIKLIHSYDCPCVVALEIAKGNPEYLNWITKEVG